MLANEIEIINEYDVESFFDLIDKTTKRNITIGILYFNSYMDVFCYDERNF